MRGSPENKSTRIQRLTLSIIILSAAGFFCGPASGYEIIRSGFSSESFIELSTGPYLVTQSVSENSASLAELKNAAVSAFSGYLSQIPSLLLNPGVAGIAGGVSADNNSTSGIEPGGIPKLFFTNELSTGTVNTVNIKVFEVMDHTGNPKYEEWAATLTYDPVERSVTLTADGTPWPKGSVFAINISSSVKDANNLALLGGATPYFLTLMDHTIDNTLPFTGNFQTRVHVPAQSYGQDFFLVLSTSQADSAINAANQKLAGVFGAGKKPATTLAIKAYDSGDAPLNSAFVANASIVFSYDELDKNGDGLIDGSMPPAKTGDLSVWHLDENKNLWVRQSGARVDDLEKRVSLDTDHFSAYALIQQVDTEVTNIYAYPSPFRPNSGNVARYGSWADGITFTNLPSQGKIRIYTITMELVRELDIIPNEIKWDAKNSAGEKVASGIYIWEARSGNNRKTGKLMVIK